MQASEERAAVLSLTLGKGADVSQHGPGDRAVAAGTSLPVQGSASLQACHSLGAKVCAQTLCVGCCWGVLGEGQIHLTSESAQSPRVLKKTS